MHTWFLALAFATAVQTPTNTDPAPRVYFDVDADGGGEILTQSGYVLSVRDGKDASRRWTVDTRDLGAEAPYARARVLREDPDGDGVQDILLELDAFPIPGPDGESRNPLRFVGWILSGRDGTPIRGVALPTGVEELHEASLDVVGDLNGDGHAELALGTVFRRGGTRVFLLDGSPPYVTDPEALTVGDDAVGDDGVLGARVLRTIEEVGVVMGYSQILAAGDLDGDGAPDLVTADPGVEDRNAIRAWSLRSGARLWETRFPPPWENFCGRIGRLPDVNGDGADELLVPAKKPPFSTPALTPVGLFPDAPATVFLVSGRDGTILWQYEGPDPDRTARRSCHAFAVGDVDGDAAADFVIASGDGYDGRDPGHLAWISGRTRDVLRSVEIGGAAAVRALLAGDVDGDGIFDLLVHDGGAYVVLAGRNGKELLRWSPPP